MFLENKFRCFDRKISPNIFYELFFIVVVVYSNFWFRLHACTSSYIYIYICVYIYIYNRGSEKIYFFPAEFHGDVDGDITRDIDIDIDTHDDDDDDDDDVFVTK